MVQIVKQIQELLKGISAIAGMGQLYRLDFANNSKIC